MGDRIKARLDWQNGMVFSGGNDKQKITIGGDDGISPMQLVLNGVAGCTSMDIVYILNKMKLKVEEFVIEVEGDRAEEHPKKFVEIHLKYSFKGKDLTEDKVERAIKLSLDKYCSASNSLQADISFEFELI